MTLGAGRLDESAQQVPLEQTAEPTLVPTLERLETTLERLETTFESTLENTLEPIRHEAGMTTTHEADVTTTLADIGTATVSEREGGSN
jgi:hypothetical protein